MTSNIFGALRERFGTGTGKNGSGSKNPDPAATPPGQRGEEAPRLRVGEAGDGSAAAAERERIARHLAGIANPQFDSSYVTQAALHRAASRPADAMSFALKAVDPATFKLMDADGLRALTAAERSRTAGGGGGGVRRRGSLPTMYTNPVQSLDLMIIGDLLKSTILGTIHDNLVRFIVGRGFEPEVRLVNPSGDAGADKARLERHGPEIERKLRMVDRGINNGDGSAGPGASSYGESFNTLAAAMISNMMAYNRAALMKEWDYRDDGAGSRIGQTIDGITYEELPNYLVLAKPRDLGIIEVDEISRGLKSVQWTNTFNITGNFTPVSDMIYLWNPLTSAKDSEDTWLYGTPYLGPVISSSKLVQDMLMEVFPNVNKRAWAGSRLITVKPEGQTEAEKDAEFAALAGAPPGGNAVMLRDPEEVAVHETTIRSPISDLVKLYETAIKSMAAGMAVPQVAVFDESAANRATMVGKLQLVHNTTIEPLRERIGESISRQWYMPNFRILYADRPDILAEYEVRLRWSNVQISEWSDNLEAALALDARKELTDDGFAKMIGEDNYTSLTREGAETNPGGQPQQQQSSTPPTSGKKGIKDTLKDTGAAGFDSRYDGSSRGSDARA